MVRARCWNPLPNLAFASPREDGSRSGDQRFSLCLSRFFLVIDRFKRSEPSERKLIGALVPRAYPESAASPACRTSGRAMRQRNFDDAPNKRASVSASATGRGDIYQAGKTNSRGPRCGRASSPPNGYVHVCGNTHTQISLRGCRASSLSKCRKGGLGRWTVALIRVMNRRAWQICTHLPCASLRGRKRARSEERELIPGRSL